MALVSHFSYCPWPTPHSISTIIKTHTTEKEEEEKKSIKTNTQIPKKYSHTILNIPTIAATTTTNNNKKKRNINQTKYYDK